MIDLELFMGTLMNCMLNVYYGLKEFDMLSLFKRTFLSLIRYLGCYVGGALRPFYGMLCRSNLE